MEALAHRVFERWRTYQPEPDEPDVVGIETTGVSSEEIAAFESRNNVALPAAFRDLWAASDGTATMDANEFIFWSLGVIEGQLAQRNESPSPDGTRWIVFADFLLCARVFALRVDGRQPALISVVAFDAQRQTDEVKVAASFEEFLSRYLDEPGQLTAGWRDPAP